MKNKIFLIQWVDGETSICEGNDVFQAINNHFGEFYQQFYYSHKDITQNYDRFKSNI